MRSVSPLCVYVSQLDPDRSSLSPSGPPAHWFHTLQVPRLRGRRGRSNSDPLGGDGGQDNFSRVRNEPCSVSTCPAGVLGLRHHPLSLMCHRLLCSETGPPVRRRPLLRQPGEAGGGRVCLRLQGHQQVRRDPHTYLRTGDGGQNPEPRVKPVISLSLDQRQEVVRVVAVLLLCSLPVVSVTPFTCFEDKRPTGGAEGDPHEDRGGRPVHRHPGRSSHTHTHTLD